MSQVDPAPVQADPQPINEPPIKLKPPVSDTDAITALNAVDGDGYTSHVLEDGAYGWVNNGTAWIFLTGQRFFQLAGEGDLSYGDLPPAPPPEPPVPQD
jgi:hypothetical protein